MKINNENIKVTTEEKEKIKKYSPSSLPLNPSNKGFSGPEIRRRLSQSIVGEEGSVLSLIKDKNTLIADKFGEVEKELLEKVGVEALNDRPTIDDVPLLDKSTGKIHSAFLNEQTFKDAYLGFGVFNEEEVPSLLDIFPHSQWDFENNEPIEEATPFEKKQDVIYITLNVTENVMYRFDGINEKFVRLVPNALGIGENEKTAYRGSAGKENRERIISLEEEIDGGEF